MSIAPPTERYILHLNFTGRTSGLVLRGLMHQAGLGYRRLSPAWCLSALEVVLQGQLEETWIGRIVTDEAGSGNLPRVGAGDSGIRWRSPRRSIEQVEYIRPELQILPLDGCEVLED